MNTGIQQYICIYNLTWSPDLHCNWSPQDIEPPWIYMPWLNKYLCMNTGMQKYICIYNLTWSPDLYYNRRLCRMHISDSDIQNLQDIVSPWIFMPWLNEYFCMNTGMQQYICIYNLTWSPDLDCNRRLFRMHISDSDIRNLQDIGSPWKFIPWLIKYLCMNTRRHRYICIYNLTWSPDLYCNRRLLRMHISDSDIRNLWDIGSPWIFMLWFNKYLCMNTGMPKYMNIYN